MTQRLPSRFPALSRIPRPRAKLSRARALELFRGPARLFAEWQSEHERTALDLRGANLQKLDLSGRDLGWTSLVNANLRHATLDRAVVQQADLSGADLRGASLVEVSGHETWMPGADLSEAYLARARLSSADLRGVRLVGARLDSATLADADLRGARCKTASFRGVSLHDAVLDGADLRGVVLDRANLDQASLKKARLEGSHIFRGSFFRTDLREAKLTDCNLCGSLFVETDLRGADLSGSHVYGISIWRAMLDGARQLDLHVQPDEDSPDLTVDNIEVAQFLYLMMNNAALRGVIDSLTSKTVLILGRFVEPHKRILDALREALRKPPHRLVPIVFDFTRPTTRDTHETMSLLAHLARFVIADITDPKSIPQELFSVVKNLRSVAVQPILLKGHEPWGMFDTLRREVNVLEPVVYKNLADLERRLAREIVTPAERRVRELSDQLIASPR